MATLLRYFCMVAIESALLAVPASRGMVACDDWQRTPTRKLYSAGIDRNGMCGVMGNWVHTTHMDGSP